MNNLAGAKDRVRTGQSIKDFVALGGKKRNGSVLHAKLTQVTKNELYIDLLLKYFYLLVHTNFLSDVAYDVLILRLTYKEVLDKYPEVKESYLRNIVYKEGKRVFTELGCDPYIAVKNQELTASEAEALLEVIKDKTRVNGHKGVLGGVNVIRGNEGGIFATNKELDSKMTLDFTKFAELDEGYIKDFQNDTEFVRVAKKLRMLSKGYADMILNSIDSRLLGYYFYLMNEREDKLSDAQLLRKQQLREVWWLNDGDQRDRRAKRG